MREKAGRKGQERHHLRMPTRRFLVIAAHSRVGLDRSGSNRIGLEVVDCFSTPSSELGCWWRCRLDPMRLSSPSHAEQVCIAWGGLSGGITRREPWAGGHGEGSSRQLRRWRRTRERAITGES
ncbi:hypothetical protein ABZP36_034670 [Zizania latifolia]